MGRIAAKQTYIPTLLRLFRQFGYEGVTLAKISQATGLGKASLYHHFPGGKAEMAAAALAEVDLWLETSILPILSSKVKPIEAFELMCQEVSLFFNKGENDCLWAVLLLEQSSKNLFDSQINRAFSRWIEAIANVLITAGANEIAAIQRGEDAVITIQGALILCHGLKDFTPFQRVIKRLPQQLCQDI